MTYIIKSKNNVPVRYVDQNDGTFALKVATTGGGGGGGNVNATIVEYGTYPGLTYTQLSSAPLLVTSTNASSTTTYVNTTIAVGGTAQSLVGANSSRKRLFVQNPSTATESLFLRFGGTATTTYTSLELLPGAAFDSSGGPCPSDAISVNAATTGHQVHAWWM